MHTPVLGLHLLQRQLRWVQRHGDGLIHRAQVRHRARQLVVAAGVVEGLLDQLVQITPHLAKPAIGSNDLQCVYTLTHGKVTLGHTSTTASAAAAHMLPAGGFTRGNRRRQ